MPVHYNDRDEREHHELRDEMARIGRLLQAVDEQLRAFAERGVPIKLTRSRIGNAYAYLQRALDQFQYDVIDGYELGTKADREKRIEHDLS